MELLRLAAWYYTPHSSSQRAKNFFMLRSGRRRCFGWGTAGSVLQHLDFFSACDDLVGRAPWPAADPLVGLFGRVRPHQVWLRLCCSVGQAFLPAAAFQAALWLRLTLVGQMTQSVPGKLINVTITGYTGFASSGGALMRPLSHEGQVSFSRVAGRHLIGFGAGYSRTEDSLSSINANDRHNRSIRHDLLNLQ
jgi:hypothetical protein